MKPGTVYGRPPTVKVPPLLPDTTSTMPRSCAAAIWYRAGLISPSGWPASWSASATMPANSGEDRLVPHSGPHSPAAPPTYRATALWQDASIEISGMPRIGPVTAPSW